MCLCTSADNAARPRQLLVANDIVSLSTVERVERIASKSVRPSKSTDTHRHPLSKTSHQEIFFDALPMIVSATAGIYNTNTSIIQECFSHIMYDYCPTKGISTTSTSSSYLLSSLSWSNVICLFIHAIYFFDILRKIVSSSDDTVSDATKSKRRRVLTYMLTWFIIDAISMVPWEGIIVQPIFNNERKRHIVFKVIGFLRACPAIKKRWQYIVKARRLARSLGYRHHMRHVRHIHKYIIFFTRMKMILLVRCLQHARWTKRLLSSIRKSIYS